jgi:hypothetical protein
MVKNKDKTMVLGFGFRLNFKYKFQACDTIERILLLDFIHRLVSQKIEE